MPHGNGSNGKSTIYGAFRRMLGGYAKSADASSFVSDGKGGSSAGGAREDLVRLMGARLVFVNEPDENEEDLLDRAWGLNPQSRLSCQAIVARQDLVIEIPKYSINHAKEKVVFQPGLPSFLVGPVPISFGPRQRLW